MAHLFQRGELPLNIILSLIHNAPPFEKGRLGGIVSKKLSSMPRKGDFYQKMCRYLWPKGAGAFKHNQSTVVIFLLLHYKMAFKRSTTCSHCVMSATKAKRTWFSPGLPCAVSRDK